MSCHFECSTWTYAAWHLLPYIAHRKKGPHKSIQLTSRILLKSSLFHYCVSHKWPHWKFIQWLLLTALGHASDDSIFLPLHFSYLKAPTQKVEQPCSACALVAHSSVQCVVGSCQGQASPSSLNNRQVVTLATDAKIHKHLQCLGSCGPFHRIFPDFCLV